MYDVYLVFLDHCILPRTFSRRSVPRGYEVHPERRILGAQEALWLAVTKRSSLLDRTVVEALGVALSILHTTH